MSFYVTKLNSPSTAVLGLNWLTAYNPLVDWTARTISFPTTVSPISDSPPAEAAPSPDDSVSDTTSDELPDSPSQTSRSPPHISLIGAAAFARACQLPGSDVYHFRLRAVTSDNPPSSEPSPAPDLSSVPPEYHEFADVFSEARAFTLPPHRPYDLKIELEDEKPLTPGRLYSLSPAELDALREFIEKNLSAGFIRQSASPHGAPILFVKKKDGSL